MSQQEPSSLQTAYRLAVMVGTLACGSLAAFLYGPPPERLAGMIDTAAERIGMVPATEATPAQIAPPAGLAPSNALTPRFDPAVQLASSEAPGQTAAGAAITKDTLLAPVHAAGAVQADLRAIGVGGDRVYQAWAAVPATQDPAGLVRRLDATGETPTAAATALVAKLRSLPQR